VEVVLKLFNGEALNRLTRDLAVADGEAIFVALSHWKTIL